MVKSSAEAWPSASQVKSSYLLSIFRNKAEAAGEQARVTQLETLSGTQPPIADTDDYDFLDANLSDLAQFTLETFPDNRSLSNKYILIVDERSARDRTVTLVEIPAQYEFDDNKNLIKETRNFQRHDEYVLDSNGWINQETGEDTGADELKVVRVTFEDANMANMLDDGHETIGTLAQSTYQTNGVFREGAAYP